MSLNSFEKSEDDVGSVSIVGGQALDYCMERFSNEKHFQLSTIYYLYREEDRVSVRFLFSVGSWRRLRWCYYLQYCSIARITIHLQSSEVVICGGPVRIGWLRRDEMR